MVSTQETVAESIRQCIMDGSVPSPAEARLAHWFPEADAAIAAYESDPPEWLVALVRGWHNSTCVGMGRVRDNGICLDAPESVRRAAGCAVNADDATPPLVAASPVPPVVPDSEALDHCSTCNDTGTVVVYEGSNDVSFTYDLPCTDCDEGSGVVPDKPALAPDEDWYGETRREAYGNGLRDGIASCGLVVPAVTDDEAATKVRAVALALAAVDGYDTYARQANEFITRLRSAGFLIVHHTKET